MQGNGLALTSYLHILAIPTKILLIISIEFFITKQTNSLSITIWFLNELEALTKIKLAI